MSSSPFSFTVGMPHMVPGQLSEVELLKLCGDYQWSQIGEALQRPAHQIVNEQNERLYSSFINIESNFGPETIAQFQEGDAISGAGTISFYAKQFIEGWVVLSRGKEAPASSAEPPQRARGLSSPWIYMTNALVAREAGNMRLKTYRPAGIERVEVAAATDKPTGIVEHEQIVRGDTPELHDPSDDRRATPLVAVNDEPIVYQACPESDLNGAGLIYFARYVAMLNYAERLFLRHRLRRPVSNHLQQFLSTERRKIYYFANGGSEEAVEIYSTAEIRSSGNAGVPHGATKTDFLTLVFRSEMYRRSDGVLMAKSIVHKRLLVPNEIKSLHSEARRFLLAHAA